MSPDLHDRLCQFLTDHYNDYVEEGQWTVWTSREPALLFIQRTGDNIRYKNRIAGCGWLVVTDGAIERTRFFIEKTRFFGDRDQYERDMVELLLRS